jgi:hypothetical protein
MDSALRKGISQDRRKSFLLASSHVHKHESWDSSDFDRRASDASVLLESLDDSLFFAADAAEAGKDGLSLLTQQQTMKRDRKTGKNYTKTPASEMIGLKCSEPPKKQLLAAPAVKSSIRMAARSHRSS